MLHEIYIQVDRLPCVAQVLGRKDSGKTAVIEKVVKELKGEGFRVLVVKPSHHVIDLQGKDTYRFRSAGADAVIFRDPNGLILFANYPDFVRCLSVDVILVEGLSGFVAPIRVEIREPSQVSEVAQALIRMIKECLSKGNEAQDYWVSLTDALMRHEPGRRNNRDDEVPHRWH